MNLEGPCRNCVINLIDALAGSSCIPGTTMIRESETAKRDEPPRDQSRWSASAYILCNKYSERLIVFSKGCLTRAPASSDIVARDYSHTPGQLGMLSGTAARPSVERSPCAHQNR
jgi:hypothetical protein